VGSSSPTTLAVLVRVLRFSLYAPSRPAQSEIVSQICQLSFVSFYPVQEVASLKRISAWAHTRNHLGNFLKDLKRVEISGVKKSPSRKVQKYLYAHVFFLQLKTSEQLVVFVDVAGHDDLSACDDKENMAYMWPWRLAR
jgi:hypothetical protein